MSAPLIVGISGASGAIYGVRLMEALHASKIPAHLLTVPAQAEIVVEGYVHLGQKSG
jgi:4-hydroxy-3-polyprenylbenzoate decarboxylase